MHNAHAITLSRIERFAVPLHLTNEWCAIRQFRHTAATRREIILELSALLLGPLSQPPNLEAEHDAKYVYP